MADLNMICDSHDTMTVFEMVTVLWFLIQSMMLCSHSPTNISWQVIWVFTELLHYFSGILLCTVWAISCSYTCALVLVDCLLRLSVIKLEGCYNPWPFPQTSGNLSIRTWLWSFHLWLTKATNNQVLVFIDHATTMFHLVLTWAKATSIDTTIMFVVNVVNY